MRKIASLTLIWNHEPFIFPHFRMLSSLERNVVLLGTKPLPQYAQEHGISYQPDRSEELLRKHFPKVEIYRQTYSGPIGAPLYNEGLLLMQDQDIVLKLDPDMLFSKKDWQRFIDFIQNTDHDCYRMDFQTNSINYYKDFDHGLKDAQEFDPLAVSPKKLFEWVLNYPEENGYIIRWNNWLCHHFRGWNKPKSVTKDFENTPYAKQAFALYSNNDQWYSCPQEIRKMFDMETANTWLKQTSL